MQFGSTIPQGTVLTWPSFPSPSFEFWLMLWGGGMIICFFAFLIWASSRHPPRDPPHYNGSDDVQWPTIYGVVLGLLLAGSVQAQSVIDDKAPLTYSGASLGDICRWTGFPPRELTEELDVAGGRMRQWYQRLQQYKEMSCTEYYGVIYTRYMTYKSQHWRDMLIWQCWWDDPCSCEQERS